MTHKTPDQFALLDLWMKQHFAHETCVVFHSPLSYFEKLKSLFPDPSSLVCAEFAVVPMAEEQALKLCHATLENECYVTVWINGELVSENT